MKNNLSIAEHLAKPHTGSATILFALALPVILAVGTIASDFGQIYIIKSELQNAADACALAAIDEVDTKTLTTDKINNAKSVGIAIAKKNQINFQRDTPNLVAADVIFDTTSTNGPFVTCNTSFKYQPTFLKLIGYKTEPFIAASGKAGFAPGASSCAIPLMTCGNVKLNEWYEFTPNGSPKTSDSIQWAAFEGGTKTKDLRDALIESNNCDINFDTQKVASKPGTIATLFKEYNARFGIIGRNDKAKYVVDHTGAYGDLLKLYKTEADRAKAYETYLNLKKVNKPAEEEFELKETASKKTTTIFDYDFDNKNTYDEDKYDSDYLKMNGANRRLVYVPHFASCPGKNVAKQPDKWECVLMINPIDGPNDKIFLQNLGGITDTFACGQTRLAGGTGKNALIPALID